METAPITLAHTHARNAALETRKANPVAASEEHDLAAGEFATVAQSSRDREALRTLHLLEQHHKKLAHILRFQHENPPSAAAGVNSQNSAESGLSKTDPQQPPRLSGNPRLPKRETSSIASNLASARGIPAQPRRSSPASPTLSSQQAGARMTDGPAKIRSSESRLRGTQAAGQRDRASRTSSQRQPWSPPVGSPTDITSQQFVPSETADSRQSRRQSATEEPFQRFYSTFEGLISRISAPLAFAGLPLGLDGASNAGATRKSSAETRLDRQIAVSDRSGSSAEPDISRIFSRAALKAIRETNGGGMGPGNPAESFYVVPTTGGTVSYAGILTRAEKEARRNSNDEAEDDFVDARETPSSPEMLQQNKGKAKGKPSRSSDKLSSLQPPKTLEELQMENQALRHLSDTLSKRLHMWEVNAQSSSMALQQSLKAMHHQNMPSPEHGPQSASAVSSPTTGSSTAVAPAPTTEHDQRIKELEEIIRLNEKELEKTGRENEKLHNVLGRYRDRWEKLKEGAKSRRAEGRAGEGSARTSSAGTAQQSTGAEVKTGETEETSKEQKSGPAEEA
ncbi:uncharacterized protein DSM5745_05561 [Aspergillus mulundensis]|uniref:Uncharacterized protein n=1 Tax=Aspergillus mulundensis TaxID=1810919 RepID=A0A3D8RXC0_9EURO|nr:Uncharacterized protein DSM5745_05561 [Aspergillus mulundensis]RDW78709.1 Uncharacterized protein DSM5745_05561 [Aspergillus mulundensis]